jgi:hypothetical protein
MTDDRLQGLTIDFIARKTLMASMLYYGLDEQFLPDRQFDRMCRRLAREWDDLDDYRQWQLGSPDEIRASGFRVRISQATEGAVVSWLMMNKRYHPIVHTREHRYSKKHHVHWLRPVDYRFREDD